MGTEEKQTCVVEMNAGILSENAPQIFCSCQIDKPEYVVKRGRKGHI